MRDTNQAKSIIIAAVSFFIFVLVLIMLMRLQKDGEKNKEWRVEGQVVKKEMIIREDKESGTEEVFLIDCEDEDGVVHTFELTDTALTGNITAEDAYEEIKTGRYYRFKLRWRNRQVYNKEGHYPSIYGAASLAEFNLSVAAEEEQSREAARAKGDTEDTSEASAADETQNTRPAETTGSAKSTSATETTARESIRETTKSRSTEDVESPSNLEIGGIKIERVEETIDDELLKSVEESVKAEMEESIRAELEESLEAEKKVLREEMENMTGSNLQN